MQLYLASKSPRRLEILQQLGISCQLLTADSSSELVDESPLPLEAPATYVERISRAKAAQGQALLRKHPSASFPCLLLAADTAVEVSGRILGKPRDAEDAVSMLRLLAGRTHTVLSGIVLSLLGADDNVRECYRVSKSRVRFCGLDENAINAYVASGEPMDKAGAYGIQGAAAFFIARLEGSYSGVMGLPIHEMGRLFHDLGIPLPPAISRKAVFPTP